MSRSRHDELKSESKIYYSPTIHHVVHDLTRTAQHWDVTKTSRLRDRSTMLTAGNTCNKTVVDARVSNAPKKRVEPQASKWRNGHSRQGRTFSDDLLTRTRRLIFPEWDVNIFISESLRLTSMPALIAWMQDFQQKEPRWGPEDDLLES